MKTKAPKASKDQTEYGFFVPTTVTSRGDGSFVVQSGKPQAWMTPAQFAKSQGLSVNTIYGHIQSGLIPELDPADPKGETRLCEYRGARRIFIRADAIEAFKTKSRTLRMGL